MSSTKKEVVTLAAELKVEVVEGSFEICLEAPRQKIFAGCGLHGTVHDYADAPRGKAEAWESAFAVLKAGLIDCPDAEQCEVCSDV